MQKRYVNLILTSANDGQYREVLVSSMIPKSNDHRFHDGCYRFLESLFDVLPRGLRVLEFNVTSRWLKGERRRKGESGRIHHPATQFLRGVDVEALGRRALLAAPRLSAVRLNLSLRPIGLSDRRYYWLTSDVGEGTAVRSLRDASVEDYNKVSSIDKEVITFMKEHRYGGVYFSYRR